MLPCPDSGGGGTHTHCCLLLSAGADHGFSEATAEFEGDALSFILDSGFYPDRIGLLGGVGQVVLYPSLQRSGMRLLPTMLLAHSCPGEDLGAPPHFTVNSSVSLPTSSSSPALMGTACRSPHRPAIPTAGHGCSHSRKSSLIQPWVRPSPGKPPGLAGWSHFSLHPHSS